MTFVTQLRHEGRTWRISDHPIFCSFWHELSDGTSFIQIYSAIAEIQSLKNTTFSSMKTIKETSVGGFF